MSFWSPEPAFTTLFGAPFTQAQLDEIKRKHDEKVATYGQFWSEPDLNSQPWHTRWMGESVGGTDECGEWHWYYQTKHRKIIRPSYGQDTAIYLVVTVNYERKAGKSRPRHWSASLQFMGLHLNLYRRDRKWWGWDSEHEPSLKRDGRSCKSKKEAMEKALRLPYLDESVKELVKRAYNPLIATARYRVEVVDGKDTYVPHCTDFRTYSAPIEDRWDSGIYLTVRWNIRFSKNPKEHVLCGSELHVDHWGYSGTPIRSRPRTKEDPPYSYIPTLSTEEHDAVVQRVGTWLRKPPDP